jgi:hypothetical protein
MISTDEVTAIHKTKKPRSMPPSIFPTLLSVMIPKITNTIEGISKYVSP